MRHPLLVLLASMALACSGPEERPEPTPTATTEPPEETPPAETPAEEMPPPECGSDADCEVVTPCCACPPAPQAMTHAEAEATRERCTRVRCAACALPAPPGDPTAACEAGQCVLRDGLAAASTHCDGDADCAVHVPCCTCPPEPAVMHVDDVEANRRSCAVRSCMACDRPYEGPTPVAACRDGACVDARP